MKLFTKPRRLFPLIEVAGIVALMGGVAARAVDFHVATPQDLQNALSLAAENGANNTIYLAAGYYAGNFNFNSSGGLNLTVESEPGLTNTDVTLDGSGGGRALHIVGAGDVTVSNLTFIRNCGNYQTAALGIASVGTGNIFVDGCRFLSRANTSGSGLSIYSGFNATIQNCVVVGKLPATSSRDGIGIVVGSGVTGTIAIYDAMISDNYQDDGMDIEGGSATTISNDVVQGNPSYGLAISSQGCRITVRDTTFSGNGGGYGDGGIYYALNCLNLNALDLEDNLFAGNPGGGVSAEGLNNGGTVALTHDTFEKNGDGGAYLSQLTTATVTDNDFDGNTYWFNGGGGLSLEGCQDVLVSQNIFRENNGAGGYTTPGGFAASGGQNVLLTGNTFVGNSGNNSAGGVAYSGAASVIIANNDFNDNHANGYNNNDGGGLAVNEAGNGSLTLTNNTFTGNSASYGGAAHLIGGTINLVDNTFRQNSASQNEGTITAQASTITISDNLVVNNTAGGNNGAMWLNPGATLNMINNTVFGNSAAGGPTGGVHFDISGTSEILNVFNNIIWGNSANGPGADVYLTGTGKEKQFMYNDADSMYGVWDITQHVLDVNPQFFDPVNGDYHLQGTSPCANAGTNGAPGMPLVDLDGNSRTNSAGQVDLGCYEFNTTATHPADTNSDFVITPTEFNAYAAAWKNGQAWTNGPSPIPADYLTRAGYLMTNGATYHNDGSQRPTNWKPGP